jgi:PAS domain S-box-containing protein
MAYSMAFGDGKHALLSLSSMVEPSALMREQLHISQNQLRRHQPQQQQRSSSSSLSKKLDTMELPKTLQDVVRQKSRAIVVTETEKPFRIVDVNQCWEGLCGYTHKEARGKTLGSLLQGPETNVAAATGLISHLLQGCGDEAGVVLTNYTKEGRRFYNRIRVGPIVEPTSGRVTHFVGVLEELYDYHPNDNNNNNNQQQMRL